MKSFSNHIATTTTTLVSKIILAVAVANLALVGAVAYKLFVL